MSDDVSPFPWLAPSPPPLGPRGPSSLTWSSFFPFAGAGPAPLRQEQANVLLILVTAGGVRSSRSSFSQPAGPFCEPTAQLKLETVLSHCESFLMRPRALAGGCCRRRRRGLGPGSRCSIDFHCQSANRPVIQITAAHPPSGLATDIRSMPFYSSSSSCLLPCIDSSIGAFSPDILIFYQRYLLT